MIILVFAAACCGATVIFFLIPDRNGLKGQNLNNRGCKTHGVC